MAERIYTIGDEGGLEPLEEAPFSTEDELQALIAGHPELLDGEQVRPGDPRRWILITREKGISEHPDAGARWSIDHLIVDQDAVPTLAEVKRGSNPEIRRTVVGQMLEVCRARLPDLDGTTSYVGHSRNQPAHGNLILLRNWASCCNPTESRMPTRFGKVLKRISRRGDFVCCSLRTISLIPSNGSSSSSTRRCPISKSSQWKSSASKADRRRRLCQGSSEESRDRRVTGRQARAGSSRANRS